MNQQVNSFPKFRIAGVFLPILFLIVTGSIKAQDTSVDTVSTVAILLFDHEDHDFGDVYEGEKVEHIFSFKNTGSGTLVIQNVISTCGCTAPEWPREPIEAGVEGKIRIVFNSRGKIGRQNKVISVRSNTRAGDVLLFITAMVLPKKKG